MIMENENLIHAYSPPRYVKNKRVWFNIFENDIDKYSRQIKKTKEKLLLSNGLTIDEIDNMNNDIFKSEVLFEIG